MKRAGLSRLAALQPPEPVRRYERESPGELVHIDTKRLGRNQGAGHRITGQRQHRSRGIGWDAVHLAIDHHSRVSYASIKPDEKVLSCVDFLRECVDYYNSLGVRIDRVMTDNGAGYKKTFTGCVHRAGHPPHPNSSLYAQDKRQGRTLRADQPQGVGLSASYESSEQRTAALKPFLDRYNWLRPHSALNHQPPMSRIPAMSNLLKLNT
jgi:transposase InsO family protein